MTSCDGYRHVRLTSALSTPQSEAVGDAREKETLFYQIDAFLEQFASAHNLKCSPHSETRSSKLYGGRSITIELKKLKEEGVDLRISQFGPLAATEEYKQIKTELINSMASRFPQMRVSDVFGSQ